MKQNQTPVSDTTHSTVSCAKYEHFLIRLVMVPQHAPFTCVLACTMWLLCSGKELIENLTVLRFSNRVFEPLWSRQYIRNVQVRTQGTQFVQVCRHCMRNVHGHRQYS